MVDYLPRTAWGARPATGSTPLDADQVEGVAIHWPGMANPLGRDRIGDALRGWQADHMENNGWSDIAYQVAVDQWGRAWTLRGLTTRSAANGSLDVNQRFGAILLVLAPGEEPSAAMTATVRGVVTDFRRWFPGANRIVPHSLIRPEPTDCPGDQARAALELGAFDPYREDDDMANAAEVLAEVQALRTEERARYIAESDRWKVEAGRWQVEAERWQQLTKQLLTIGLDPAEVARLVVAELPTDGQVGDQAMVEAALRAVLLQGVET